MVDEAPLWDIKEVTSDKFDEIWPFFQKTVKAGETLAYSPSVKKEEARVQWFTATSHVYHGYLNGVAVASRHIQPNKWGLGSHVANMGVVIDPSYRGQGLGRKMMAFGIDKAKELGFRAIQLNLVVSTNEASIRLCKEFGFEIIGAVPEAFHYKQQRYVDAYIMYRKL